VTQHWKKFVDYDQVRANMTSLIKSTGCNSALGCRELIIISLTSGQEHAIGADDLNRKINIIFQQGFDPSISRSPEQLEALYPYPEGTRGHIIVYCGKLVTVSWSDSLDVARANWYKDIAGSVNNPTYSVRVDESFKCAIGRLKREIYYVFKSAKFNHIKCTNPDAETRLNIESVDWRGFVDISGREISDIQLNRRLGVVMGYMAVFRRP
jgi:hypothetical protein